MSKFLVSLVTLALLSPALAAACEGEAQVIATVKERRTNSLTYCKAFFDASSFSHYSSSGVCPLPLSKVLAEGVNFPLENGHDCNVPEEISGVLVLKYGQIYLE